VAGAVNAPPSGETWFTAPGGVLKRTNGGPAAPVRVRPWPKGDAIALVSHTMKEEQLAKLHAEYGFDRPQAMDSSIKLARIAEGSADIYRATARPWSGTFAAGHALLEAAGGSFLTPDGGPFTYGKASEGSATAGSWRGAGRPTFSTTGCHPGFAAREDRDP